MHFRARFTLLIPLAVLFTLIPTAIAQLSQSGPTPRALIEKAVAFKNKTSRTRYTYFELDHLQNRFKDRPVFNRRLSLDATTLYEYTWIGDLPYGRIVELQGKPLTGDALAKEQARYDHALAEHNGLAADDRAKSLHMRMVKYDIKVSELLTPAYTLTEPRQEAIDGNLLHVIDCIPVPSTGSVHPTDTRHVQLWIAESGAILRVISDIIADEPEMLHGSHMQFDSQIIDGDVLPLHTVGHFYTPVTKNIIIVDIEETYTRYRRFNVTSRVVSADDQPIVTSR